MPLGSIASTLYAGFEVAASVVRRDAQGFVLGLPPQQDVGHVTAHTFVTIYLWNGSTGDTVVSSITGDDEAEGISWDAAPPAALPALQSLRVIFDVSVDGPLEFTALLSFVAACKTVYLTLTGTRSPQLSGDIGYLLFGHNWQDGLTESLEWQTDVMIAHDRTEQRVQLRSLPRRFWDLRLLVAGRQRRKLETWLTMRKTRYLFMPIWRDAVRLLGPIAAGETTIAIDGGCDNYVDGTPIVVWDSWEHMEVRTLQGHGSNFLSVSLPFNSDWSTEAMLAPARYCLSLSTRRVSRFTEDVGDYRLTLMATNDGWEPTTDLDQDVYRDLVVCPFVPNWSDDDEQFDNKWVSLDNDTGVIEVEVQSIEPVLSRDATFLVIGRERIMAWLTFLQARAGRLAPFWLAANDRGFELSAAAAADQDHIVIEPIDYAYALSESEARSHLEMITTGGEVIRRMVLSVETLPSGEEKLTLDAALGVAITKGDLNRCAWLELVRLDSDEVKLHWVTAECLEVTVPIVVLP